MYAKYVYTIQVFFTESLLGSIKYFDKNSMIKASIKTKLYTFISEGDLNEKMFVVIVVMFSSRD